MYRTHGLAEQIRETGTLPVDAVAADIKLSKGNPEAVRRCHLKSTNLAASESRDSRRSPRGSVAAHLAYTRPFFDPALIDPALIDPAILV
jgi:hypothetical protein